VNKSLYIFRLYQINIKTMPKEKIKIEFNEKDLKELIVEKYKLKIETTTIHVSHYNGDSREPSYTSVIVEGERDNFQ
jgi:hypothetical protein